MLASISDSASALLDAKLMAIYFDSVSASYTIIARGKTLSQVPLKTISMQDQCQSSVWSVSKTKHPPRVSKVQDHLVFKGCDRIPERNSQWITIVTLCLTDMATNTPIEVNIEVHRMEQLP